MSHRCVPASEEGDFWLAVNYHILLPLHNDYPKIHNFNIGLPFHSHCLLILNLIYFLSLLSTGIQFNIPFAFSVQYLIPPHFGACSYMRRNTVILNFNIFFRSCCLLISNILFHFSCPPVYNLKTLFHSLVH